MIFDTHAHYDDEQFNEDRVELLNSMEEQGVGTIINVSATYNSCRKVIALAKEYPFVYAAVGIHPDEVGCLNEENFAQMKELFKEEKVVAVGEIGLDYYWDNEPREVQKKWFIRQLELARELDLPVLIHSREAAADTMEIMKEHAKGLSGVIHNGYKQNCCAFHDSVPLTSIVLETDCPYMAPEPNRGKRNNSAYIRYVAEKIAELKGITYEEVVEQTEKNAREMYRL